MYYPKSQIKPGLYTRGNELVYASNKENYIGYYYKTSQGNFFSGKTPNSLNSERLILLTREYLDYTNPELLNEPILEVEAGREVEYTLDPDYRNATDIDYYSRILKVPSNTKVYPTKKDYELGQFTRYFVKKVNTPLFKELTQENYRRYVNKDQYVQYDLYIPFKLIWCVSGEDKNKVANLNYKTLQLTEKRYKVKNLVNYFKNKLTEYYKKVD